MRKNRTGLILWIALIAFVAMIAIPVKCAAQIDYQTKKELPESVKVISLFVGSIVLDAFGDALCDDGHKGWGHTFNAASVGLLVTAPLYLEISFKELGWYLASYVSLRIAIFDPVYNLSRDLPLNYIGTTSTWDKALQKISPPGNTLLWGRAAFLTVGISIPIKHLK